MSDEKDVVDETAAENAEPKAVQERFILLTTDGRKTNFKMTMGLWEAKAILQSTLEQVNATIQQVAIQPAAQPADGVPPIQDLLDDTAVAADPEDDPSD